MPSSDIVSLSEFSASTYNSRLRRVSTFLSSDSDSTQNCVYVNNLADRSDFRVQSCGSVWDFRLEVRGV